MKSRPKWEELARDGCCGVFSSVVSAEELTYMLCLSMENRAYSEGRKEAGYIFIVLWERCFCMAANGIREEYLFQMLPYLFYRWHTLLGFISKKKND